MSDIWKSNLVIKLEGKKQTSSKQQSSYYKIQISVNYIESLSSTHAYNFIFYWGMHAQWMRRAFYVRIMHDSYVGYIFNININIFYFLFLWKCIKLIICQCYIHIIIFERMLVIYILYYSSVYFLLLLEIHVSH